MDENSLSKQIIGAAIEVHRHLGPGLLENAYEAALKCELGMRGIAFESQKPVPVVYKGQKLDVGYRLDLLIDGLVVVELKSVETVLPVHAAQIITYLKITGCRLGLLLNFNVPRMTDGIQRYVNNL